MNKVKIGDAIVYKNSKTLIQKGIQKLTNSEYFHVGVYIGHGLIFESISEGPTITSLIDVETDTGIDVYRYKYAYLITFEQALSFVKMYDSKKYGFVDILKIFISILTGKFIDMKSSSVICTELYVDFLKHTIHGKLFPNMNSDYIHPVHIAEHKDMELVKRW